MFHPIFYHNPSQMPISSSPPHKKFFIYGQNYLSRTLENTPLSKGSTRSPCSTLLKTNKPGTLPLAYFETHIAFAFTFFDLEKAYDTTWQHHILQHLSFDGICRNMGVFIKSFLSDCTFYVRFASSTG